MNMKKFEKIILNREVEFVFAALVSGILILLVYFKSGIYFETNDDRYIASILSGVVAGRPSSMIIYEDFLITKPISFLYKITNKVPWYGLTMVMFHWLVYTCVLDGTYTKCRKVFHMFVATVIISTIFVSYYYLLGQIQFTSTAILLALAGYGCVCLYGENKAGYGTFFILEILAHAMRNKAMLLAQPIGMAAYFAFVLFSKSDIKRKIKECTRILMLFVLVLVCAAGINCINGYWGKDYTDCRKFDKSEQIIFDYNGKPEYEEVREILEQYGVSEIQYEAYLCYANVLGTLPLECENALADYTYSKNSYQLQNAAEGIKDIFFESYQWNMNWLPIILLIVLLIWAAMNKDMKLIMSGLGILAGELFVFGFLFYQGRVLMRVTVPLFAGVCMLIVAILMCDIFERNNRNNVKRCFIFIVCIIMLGVGIKSGEYQYRYVKEVNFGQSIFMESFREIIEYCEKNPDNKYIIDAVSASYYKGSALETDIYHPSNYVISGGWFSNYPDVRKHMQEYLANGEGMYLIIYSDANTAEKPPVKYLKEKTGSESKLVDIIRTSSGAAYDVYYFDGKIDV